MLQITRDQSIRNPGHRDFEERQVSWIGENQVYLFGGDVFARGFDEVKDRFDISELKPEHRAHQDFAILA